MVEVDNKLGFINDKGELVVKPIYDKIGQFGDVKSDWLAVTLNDKVGFINDKGKEVIKPSTQKP